MATSTVLVEKTTDLAMEFYRQGNKIISFPDAVWKAMDRVGVFNEASRKALLRAVCQCAGRRRKKNNHKPKQLILFKT